MINKFTGIVIREKATGESDKLLTILTDGGKIHMMAKGVRKLSSHNMVASRLFTYAEFTAYEKNNFYWLKEANQYESFFDLNKNIETLTAAQYFLELADTISLNDSDESELLRLLLNSLYALAKQIKSVEFIKAVYELRVLEIAGFMPTLGECSVCGKYTDPMYLDLSGGVLKCDKCFHYTPPIPDENDYAHIYSVLPQAVHMAMLYVFKAEDNKIFSFNLSDDSLEILSTICEKYLQSHFDKKFQTLEFYHSIK